MKCEDEAELYEEYARVIRMCKFTNANQIDCWKFDGIKLSRPPVFKDNPNLYTFAIAIVYDQERKEDRPVFEGDILYDKKGGACTAYYSINWDYSVLSWNPPKKNTFMLNEEELPLPDGDLTGYRISINYSVSGLDKNDMRKVQNAINKLLSVE